MAAIITNDFRINNAKAFAAGASTNNYYMFIGKPTPWANPLSPDTPHDTFSDVIEVWDDVMSMKKISSSAVVNGIYNRQWTANKFYDVYRHDYNGSTSGYNIDTGASTAPATLADANYYVVTDNGNIYICLGNGGGVASTVNPKTIGTGMLPVTTADGYIWKFMSDTQIQYQNHITTFYYPVATTPAALVPMAGGAIVSVIITNGGSGYTSAPTVSINGDGTGFAVGTVTVSGGKVTRIDISTYGQNYTWCDLTISGGGVGASGATAKAVVTPHRGLGADPVLDLNAFFAIMNVSFSGTESDFTTSNDYRRVGLVINPTDMSDIVLTSATADATTTLTVTGTWLPDTIVEDSSTGARGIVVDAPTGKIRVIQTYDENSGSSTHGAFGVGHTITSVPAGTTGSISAITSPEVKKYSGSMVYYENRKAITRDLQQTESITVTFEF